MIFFINNDEIIYTYNAIKPSTKNTVNLTSIIPFFLI